TPDCQARRHSVTLPLLWSEIKAAFSPQVKGTFTLQFMTQYKLAPQRRDALRFKQQSHHCTGLRSSSNALPVRFVTSFPLEEAPAILVSVAPGLGLRFGPATSWTRAICSITTLRDHAFQPHALGGC